MGDEVKQQRWEFRRKDNDNDSSSDDSKSSSEAAHEKRKLVSGLISLENDEAVDNCRAQQTGMFIPCGEDQNMSKKAKRVHLRSKKNSRKKSKTGVYNSAAALDELKIFKESLLENLKVTRENFLSWMRKEMQKLVDDDAAPRLERREGSSGGKNVQVQHGNDFEKNTIYKENIQVNNERKNEDNIQHQNNFGKNVPVHRESNSKENVFAHHHNNVKETVQVQHLDEKVKFQVNYRNNFEFGTKPRQCDIESLGRSVKSNTAAGSDNLYHVKPNFQSYSTDKNVLMQHPSQVPSSMYLTLPTVLTKPRGENYTLSTSSSNYIGTPFDINKLDVNSVMVNPMLKVKCGKLSGMQQLERDGSFPQIRSRNANCFDKQRIPSSSIGNGFPVPFHQGDDIGLSIPSQVSSEYLPREEKNIMGLKMEGGASSFFGGSYTKSEDYFANNVYRHSMSKAHGTHKAFQNKDLEEGYLFPK
ncbi:uncharacterized protein LOC103938471 [Pyrus x bretschneideri]|uniref:uncharacterized protein LOC103938471 n=1 Tax=Pyrus x bretschneideri TaxID=225117 RepID=UPI00203069E2|nr:uncharacterized protein LOC103938471 [Pyrus x bretschneideri]